MKEGSDSFYGEFVGLGVYRWLILRWGPHHGQGGLRTRSADAHIIVVVTIIVICLCIGNMHIYIFTHGNLHK